MYKEDLCFVLFRVSIAPFVIQPHQSSGKGADLAKSNHYGRRDLPLGRCIKRTEEQYDAEQGGDGGIPKLERGSIHS